ncbi:hypothetical protein B0H14DRAFT_2558664 [Mycena olivaceomarginata]|nr:hypothetical protein B0H14DRAFT_2558664 [Mycena olivaceomarginata]
MGSTEPRTDGVGDEEMRGGVAEVQGGVGVDGEKSPSAARVHDAGDNCDYWSRDVGAEASRPREGKRGEADKDRLAEDRRLGQESEANSDEPRSGSVLACASIPQYEARAHPLPTCVLPIHMSLGSPSPSIFSPYRPPLAPLTHMHRCGSSRTGRRSGVNARNAPLEFADSRQNALKGDELGAAWSEGVAVEAHEDPKVGAEEREARREVEGATTRIAERSRQRRAQGRGRVVFASQRWEVECLWVSVSAVSFVGRNEKSA